MRIADYAIGLPGSVHDASAFQKTHIAHHPEEFFNNNEWLWADSTYASQIWCVTPFKKPVGIRLGQDKRTFNRQAPMYQLYEFNFFIFGLLLIIILGVSSHWTFLWFTQGLLSITSGFPVSNSNTSKIGLCCYMDLLLSCSAQFDNWDWGGTWNKKLNT